MSKVGKLFDEVEQTYFNLDTKPVTRVYADLEYLQDLKFGALLYGISVETEMKYINSCLSTYNNRYDQCTAKYFGALQKTDEQLTSLLHTAIKKDRICFLAPWTSVYYHLIEIIMLFKKHNQRMLEQDTKIHLTINIADVDYPIELQKCLKQTIEQQLDIVVDITQNTRYSEPVSEYLNYDMMLLYDYGLFVNTFPTEFVGEGKFTDIKILAMPYIDSTLGYKSEDYEYVLASTEKGMDIYCDFLFLRSLIIKDNKDE